jgi:hypothetical protein
MRVASRTRVSTDRNQGRGAPARQLDAVEALELGPDHRPSALRNAQVIHLCAKSTGRTPALAFSTTGPGARHDDC